MPASSPASGERTGVGGARDAGTGEVGPGTPGAGSESPPVPTALSNGGAAGTGGVSPAGDGVAPDAGVAGSGVLGSGVAGGGAGGNSGAAGGGVLGGEELSARSGSIGRYCATDNDCLAPQDCIQATSNDEFQEGGPQGGYCSFRCTTNDECAAVDELSACNTSLGRCFALCLPGVSDVKCGMDRAQVCIALEQEVGVCTPRCTSDAACGPGRFCDPGLGGLCRDQPRAGGGTGAPCAVETQEADCASGLCIQYADPANPAVGIGTFCSANCTYLVANGCGFDSVSTGVRAAACLGAQLPNGQAGDLGFCSPLCNSTGDCEQRDVGWVCDPFDDPIAVAQVGRFGECVPAAYAMP